MTADRAVAAVASDSSLALVCSLDAAGLADRAREFRQLFGTALLSYDREPTLLRMALAVADEQEAAVRELFAGEAECCPFFTFEFQRDERALVLTMGVPDDGAPMLDEFEQLVAAARTTVPPLPQADQSAHVL